MFTEAEAKTKWCPLARVVLDDDHKASGNRDQRFGHIHESPVVQNSKCIGSACMAWRVGIEGFEFRSDNGRNVTRTTPPEGDGWERHPRDLYWRRKVSEPQGYCGAFGKPK